VTYRVITTARFEPNAERFRRHHLELRERLDRVLRDLGSDPHQARLRLHALHGELDGTHAVRINYQYRITLTLQVTEREIFLLDIGTHDQVYRGGFE
jgi:mRNA-degrading endonuclease YafQ of YafQ-DinJ toxin-antitoxin module